MSRRSKLAGAAVAALAAVPLLLTSAEAAPSSPRAGAQVQTFLSEQLSRLSPLARVDVMVHGRDIAAATAAVRATGMRLVDTWDRIGVAVARGTPAQIVAARARPGVTYLEGNQPIEYNLNTSHQATNGDLASANWEATHGVPLDGRGVSVAIIDTGVDGTHPFFRNPGGSSAVVKNLKYVCGPLEIPGDSCFLDLTAINDTDTLSLGGHGTHVAGIAGGRHVTTTSPVQHELHGAAPGTSIVSLSVGAGQFIIGADAALNWVLEHHDDPCGNGSCPPIVVTNNSYGPSGGGSFDPNSATVQLQRALAAEGVLTVWAAGNDGGDGSAALTNPPGQDPSPGIISVASYFDQATGTRDGVLSDFSSRGLAGDQGTYPDLAAPGEDIESACRLWLVVCMTGLQPVNGPGLLDLATFNTISGTSMAAPHITGIVAQLFQANPDATPADIEEALVQTAHQFTDGEPYEPDAARGGQTSFDKGHGLVDVDAAVDFLTS
ncbi:MAG: S8 family peptidase [Acidimicrobiales bacterium]